MPNSMHTHAPSSAQARRSSPSSSSSPPSSTSSSSSSDSLAPTSFDFKRSRHRRLPRSPALFPPPCRSPTLGERVDDFWGSVTEIIPSRAESLKLCPQKMPYPARSVDAPVSITGQEENSVALARSWQTVGMRGEDISKHVDVDKEEEGKRKLVMWRAACAMAHAYLHQHDSHRHLHQHHSHRHELHRCELHQHELHQYGLHEPNQQQHMRTINKDGPHLHAEVCNAGLTQALPLGPTKGSNSDELYPSSMCSLKDVICIDEVVNPTQAAEWFGTLFLSASTLVS